MVSERKQISKQAWNVVISILFVAIVVLVISFVGILISNGSDSRKAPQEVESDITIALEESLRFYSPDVEYQIGDIYMVADGYAVVMLDVDGVNYRALMNNDGDGWEVLSYPRIVFSYEDFLDVPEEILKKANEVGR